MADDFYIDEIQDYLELKCELNKLVKHNVVLSAGEAPQRAFARFESDEHITMINNNGAKNIVVVADYHGQRIGDVDEKKLRMTVEVIFAVKKEPATEDETNAINDALKLAEKIMFQFWNQMEKDYQEGCNALEYLEPGNVNWNKIDDQPWLNDFYGWILNVPFGSYMPGHDEGDWE